MTTLINGSLPTPKQIRFVNNQGQPPSKRRRVNAACLTCRKRKTRCAGEKPICSTCTKNGHDCLGFVELVERKGRSGVASGSSRNGRGDDGDSSNELEDSYMDDQDEERRHWKSKAGRSASLSSHHVKAERRGSFTVMSGSDNRSRTQSNDWDFALNSQAQGSAGRQQTFSHRNASYSEDGRSSNNGSPVQHHVESHRVPYFRYFGPTAIVPGFKQMVVNVSRRDRRRSRGGSFSAVSPGSFIGQHGSEYAAPLHTETILESLDELPAYDPNDPSPVDPLIIDLVRTFFLRLGCNYPFLKEEKCLRMIKEKRLEPMLVDSICALAARFTELSVATRERDGKTERSQCGHVFAQRAKAATVDTFPCPSVGVVQACLLMAYEGFGENQDSTLWMYLGLAIRMAVDLGLQKMVGVKYHGEKDPWYTRTWSRKASDGDMHGDRHDNDDDRPSAEEQHDIEQERIDTFWAVFVLDRVISSGTGRPVTFRDDDFELALPEPTVDPASGYPAPFPHFIRIIHLYGRVSDVLNKISSADDLTEDKMSKLAQMESDLTAIYRNQDPKLNFSAQNFQEYVKAGQGTTFILLHFWFHALIIVLHQPTLVMPFGSFSRAQLLPNSHELSMSSARTISDILAFAELIDPKSFIGNPFTSQPMYIAACAFLMESAAKDSVPPSREPSPRPDARFDSHTPVPLKNSKVAKHLLLTSTANQNYQRCYKSLQHLHDYWSGVKYILTALDQRSKGIWDCETYTNEELEDANLPRRPSLSRLAKFENVVSPKIVPMALSLTGTTNSPNPSLTLLYQNNVSATPVVPPQQHPTSAPVSAPTPPGNMIYDPIRQSLPDSTSMFPPPPYPQPYMPAIRHQVQYAKPQRHSISSGSGSHNRPFAKYEHLHSDDMDSKGYSNDNRGHMHSGMSHQDHSHAPPPPASFTHTPSSHSSGYEGSIGHAASPASTMTDPGSGPHHSHNQAHHHTARHSVASNQHTSGAGSSRAMYHSDFAQSGLNSGAYPYLGPVTTDVITLGEMPIDINALGLNSDVPATWLEYLPDNVLEYFENSLVGEGHDQM
ncbi:fungal-specific transcription factor domain-containing protein [Coniochaeta sp. 2T2.1]|nr:fungal-specific transcription factor domain-containing protein [Coniochaeta sp. 2T2.1]